MAFGRSRQRGQRTAARQSRSLRRSSDGLAAGWRPTTRAQLTANAWPRRLCTSWRTTRELLFPHLCIKCGRQERNRNDFNDVFWKWWARQDSNLQPSGYEPLALTIELRARRRGTVASLQHKPEPFDASARRSLVANEACASRRGERRRRVLDRVARLRRRSSPFRDSPLLHYCNATVNLQVAGTNPTYSTL
jgi:hypothetical protein